MTKDFIARRSLRFAVALLLAPIAFAQIENNGTLPIAPQPPDMPPPGLFTVTAVAAPSPNDHFPVRFTSTAGGKSFGYLLLGLANLGIIYDAASQNVTFSNQFTPPASAGLQVLGTDGVNQTGVNSGATGTRCFEQTPGGLLLDSRALSSTFSPFFLTAYSSACTGIDNGTTVGTAFNQVWTRTLLTGGESFSTLTGYSQTAFAGNTTLSGNALGTACCSSARGVRGDQVVGAIIHSFGGLPLPNDPLGLDNSAANNPLAAATLWRLSDPANPVNLAPQPSMAIATNGSQQGGWFGSHAAMWSGTNASFVDLNPSGYFDSEVTGMTLAFQVGDGWLGGPANSPGAVRHALLWKGSAASVIDLNQFLPPTVLGASIKGVDSNGNIVGSMIAFDGRELGLLFQPSPSGALTSFTLTPSKPAPGDTVAGSVTLGAPAPAAGVTVTFTSSNPALAPAPAPVVIPAGQTVASFYVPVNANYFLTSSASVTLVANAGLTALPAVLGVTPAAAVDPVVSLTAATASVAPGDTVIIQANLAAPAPAAGVFVNFASSNPTVLPAPASLLIPAGQSSASVSVVTNSTPLWQPVSVVLQGQTGATILQVTVNVATTPAPAGVFLTSQQNTAVVGATTGSGLIPFTATVEAPGVIAVTNTNPALVVPASLQVFPGSTMAAFTYTALPVSAVTSGVVSVTLNGVTKSNILTVNPSPSPTIQSVTVPFLSNTQTWSSGQTLTGTITLSGQAYLGGMTATLSTDSPTVVQLPNSVAVPALATSIAFPVTALAVTAPTTVTITATLPGVPAASITLTVIPGPALAITSYTLAPYTMIGPGVVTIGTVTINQPALPGGVTISLAGSPAQPAKFPATVTIPAGQNSATFSVQGNGVSTATTVVLNASYSGPLAPLGASMGNTLTVAPADTLHVTKATWSKTTQTFALTATSTNATAIVNVLNGSGNAPLGTMTNLGAGSYTFQMTIASIASVNLKSNLGGATGQGVTVLP